MSLKKLPLAAMGKLLKEAGAKRVSVSAEEALEEELEEKLKEIVSDASIFAEHAGRKTIKKEDIELALRIKRRPQ